MAADRGVDPSTTTCERSAHLLAPSHLVAVTIFTAGLAWPYWQKGIAEYWDAASERSARRLRALPVAGPFLLVRDAAERSYDPVATLRLQADLIVVMLLQLAYGGVVILGIARWRDYIGPLDALNGVGVTLRNFTNVWQIYALILIAAVSAIFTSDAQSTILAQVHETEPRCPDSDQHLDAHLPINFIAAVGAIAILTTLLTLHGDPFLLASITLVAVFAYVNGSRQRSGARFSAVLGLRLWAHTTARHGGLVAGIVLIAISVFLLNLVFDVNEGTQGFGVGVFVNPHLLRPAAHGGSAKEVPIVLPDLVSADRVSLRINVPLAKKGSFVFAVAKFRTEEADDRLSSHRVFGDARPACSIYDERGNPRAVPLMETTLVRRGGNPEAAFIGEPFAEGDVQIRCDFTDPQPDILPSTFARRSISFASCCVDDGILPSDLYRTQSEVKIDLHDFLAYNDVALFGGRIDLGSPFDQRVRVLSSFNSRDVRDSPAQRELTAQWTERKRAESRDFTVIVSASLLGVALVCILEWLRPRIVKFAHRRGPRPTQPV